MPLAKCQKVQAVKYRLAIIGIASTPGVHISSRLVRAEGIFFLKVACTRRHFTSKLLK